MKANFRIASVSRSTETLASRHNAGTRVVRGQRAAALHTRAELTFSIDYNIQVCFRRLFYTRRVMAHLRSKKTGT